MAAAAVNPIWRVIELTWTDVYLSDCPADPELWMNPADWEAAGRPWHAQITAMPNGLDACGWRDMPVRRSLGVPAGSVRFFDRKTLRYLPVARPV